MRRFLAEVAAFLVLQAAILIGLDAFYTRHVTPDHYMLAWRDKAARLAVTRSPRLILVGGSSSAFGTDSGLLGRAFRRPAVNLGLHGGLGLRFLLSEAKEAVEEGDVVLLSPEYELMLEDGNWFHGTTVLDLLTVAPEAARHLSRAQMAMALDRALYAVAKRPAAVLAWAKGEPLHTSDYLRRSAFDELGDMRQNDRKSSNKSLTDRVGSSITPGAVDGASVIIKEFVVRVRARGAEVCLVPPPIPESSYAANRRNLDEAWTRLRQAIGGCVLADHPLAYPDELFFDDNAYHLSRPRGARMRTKDLISRLRERFPRREAGRGDGHGLPALGY